MIQELFGGATSSLIAAERKTSTIDGGVLLPNSTPSSSSSSPCPPSTTTTLAAASSPSTTTTAPNSSENQNLRCPRCDSSNTKFCYYNNYNLTQPRHFCKTCRRYWTKGGALRNVPIGGGCRKGKNVGSSVPSSATKPAATKMKTVAASSELVTPLPLGLRPGFDHQLPSGPILWGSPQNSHPLSLLRARQNQNPNPNPSPVANLMESQSREVTDPLASNVVFNSRPFGYDSAGQVHSLGLCNSFWRNGNQDHQHQQTNNGGFLLGEHQNGGIQELYQKPRASTTTNHCSGNNNSTVFLGNMASNSSSSSFSNILESTSVSELGYWDHPTLSWPDLPTTNGAYP